MKDRGDSPAAASTDTTKPVHVESESHLETLIEGSRLLLVDFHAEWCGPCQALEPTVESLAADTPATVAKVDIDDLRELAREHEVRGVPTMQLYADGELVEQLVGLRDEGTLRKLVGGYA
jgi:thioredoxin 1